MEAQKPMVDMSRLEHEKPEPPHHPDHEHHHHHHYAHGNTQEHAEKHEPAHHFDQEHHHHHGSTHHLFDSKDRKKSHEVLPYSLYLMNNNWHSDPQLTASRFRWTTTDYLCGLALGILLFLGLAATEFVNRLWGKVAVMVYLICFILFFFLLITRFFIIQRRK